MVLLRSLGPEVPRASTATADHAVLLALGVEEASAGSHSEGWFVSLSQAQHVDVIFILCVVIYCGITALWAFYWIICRQQSFLAGKLYTPLICISWGMTSVCMHVLNKATVERTQAPAAIATIQMAIAVGMMVPLAIFELFQVNLRQLSLWLVFPLFYGGAVCTSSFTYNYISLSLYAILRNLTPLIVMPIERLLMGEAKAPTITTTACLALLVNVAGAVLYVGGIQGFSWKGIAFAVLNVVLAVIDRFIQRRLLTEECKELPTKVCTLVNNAVGILPSIIVSLSSHEIQKARLENAAAWNQPHNIILILLSGIAGLAICYLGFECQRIMSVTSFYVMQNVSRVFLIVVGVLLFKDPLQTVAPILGMILSLGGSCVYGHIQMHSQSKGPAQTMGESEVNTAQKLAK